MKKKVLFFVCLLIISLITLGEVTETNAVCSACDQLNHAGCTDLQWDNYNSTKHIATCCCGAASNVRSELHTLVPVGQGSICKKCSKCDYTTSHTYGTWRDFSDTQHDKVCSGCGIYAYRADHYDNNDDGKCDACGHIMRLMQLPTIESVRINNGASTTKNLEVILEIKATNVSEIYVSNTSDTPDANSEGWISYKLYTKHKLTWSNEAKTVYVWGKDESNNMTTATTASITLNMSYSISLKNNQKYLGRLKSYSKYAIKLNNADWRWQDSNVFTSLVPMTVYTLKTQLYDDLGISGDSAEIKLRATYDEYGKLYIEYLN